MSISLNSNCVPTIHELQSYKMIAEVAANNPFWKKLGGSGTPDTIIATILSVMLLAREIGISPMQAISGGINNIQGKFEISARLMNQLIRRNGHKLAIRMSNDTVCVIWSQRKDTGEEHEEKYTIEEAIRAGLVKEGGAWKKIPSDMLFARCMSRMARRLYADCISGCYIEGELQESIKGEVLQSIEVPNRNEFNSEEVNFSEEIKYPEDIDTDRVNVFISEISAQTKNSIHSVKKAASKNMDGFIKKFKEWEIKKYDIDEKKEQIAV